MINNGILITGQTKKPRQKGFTLIEMMVVVAILGILAMIALPAYQDSIRKGKRADAKGALMSFAGAMERHFTSNGTYLGAGTTGGNTGAPTIFSTTSPVDGGTASYNLTISAVTASTFTLNAEATGGQAGDGDMQLTNTGVRRWDSDDSGGYGSSENTW
jgi:type IV pilus assembly protein PilE